MSRPCGSPHRLSTVSPWRHNTRRRASGATHGRSAYGVPAARTKLLSSGSTTAARPDLMCKSISERGIAVVGFVLWHNETAPQSAARARAIVEGRVQADSGKTPWGVFWGPTPCWEIRCTPAPGRHGERETDVSTSTCPRRGALGGTTPPETCPNRSRRPITDHPSGRCFTVNLTKQRASFEQVSRVLRAGFGRNTLREYHSCAPVRGRVGALGLPRSCRAHCA